MHHQTGPAGSGCWETCYVLTALDQGAVLRNISTGEVGIITEWNVVTADQTAWLNRLEQSGNKPEEWLEFLTSIADQAKGTDTEAVRTYVSNLYARALKVSNSSPRLHSFDSIQVCPLMTLDQHSYRITICSSGHSIWPSQEQRGLCSYLGSLCQLQKVSIKLIYVLECIIAILLGEVIRLVSVPMTMGKLLSLVFRLFSCSTFDPEDARSQFSHARYIARHFAVVHVASAQFELSQG